MRTKSTRATAKRMTGALKVVKAVLQTGGWLLSLACTLIRVIREHLG